MKSSLVLLHYGTIKWSLHARILLDNAHLSKHLALCGIVTYEHGQQSETDWSRLAYSSIEDKGRVTSAVYLLLTMRSRLAHVSCVSTARHTLPDSLWSVGGG